MSDLEGDLPILKLLLLVGLFLMGFALMADVRRVGSLVSNSLSVSPPPEICQGDIHPDVVLSREKLAAFLTISERDLKSRVQEILQQPYCQLPGIEVRAGVISERAVYPLAFDPQTWLVVLYEGEEYAGYQFRFQAAE